MGICLADWQQVLVYFRIRPVLLETVYHHQPCGDFYSALQERDPLQDSLVLGSYHPCALKLLGLI